MTALQRFARHSENNGAIVRLLLRAGADPDRKDPQGNAPLHAAIRSGGSYGKAEVVDALLDGGANPCVRDARRYTPYQISSDMNRIHRALSRAGGGDLACDDASKQADQGAGAALEPFGPNWIIAENQPCQRWNPNPQPGETYRWSGDCVDGKVSGEGRGVWHRPDGGKDVYEGSMRDGKWHGQRTFTSAKGTRYEGEWRNNRRVD